MQNLSKMNGSESKNGSNKNKYLQVFTAYKRLPETIYSLFDNKSMALILFILILQIKKIWLRRVEWFLAKTMQLIHVKAGTHVSDSKSLGLHSYRGPRNPRKTGKNFQVINHVGCIMGLSPICGFNFLTKDY